MRNYVNEGKWQKEKYCRLYIYLDKELGEKLKTKLKKENKPINQWVKENAENYLKS